MLERVRRLLGSKGHKNYDSMVSDTLGKPFRFSIDIVDACNLRCVTCPRSVYHNESTSDRMDIELFRQILDKIASECECKVVDLFNWTEPFLHPELDRFIYEAKIRGMGCVLSTNLSFRKFDLLEAVLKQTPALIVSVSGFTQEMHELYHVGGDINKVKDNLEFIAEFREKAGVRSRVEVHCLQFIDNEEDQRKWEEYCKEHDFIFLAKPAGGLQTATPERVERLLWKPKFEESPDGQLKTKTYFSDSPIFDPCRLHNRIALDCRGDVYLCCIYWYEDKYRIGSYLGHSIKDIQHKRLTQHDCSHCLSRMKP